MLRSQTNEIRELQWMQMDPRIPSNWPAWDITQHSVIAQRVADTSFLGREKSVLHYYTIGPRTHNSQRVRRTSCLEMSWWHIEQRECIHSLDWNAGMEYWNGILDWNTGMECWIGPLDWNTKIEHWNDRSWGCEHWLTSKLSSRPRGSEL